MSRTILFDFDGTIAETMAAGVSAFNQVARQYGFIEITPDNADLLRDQGPRGVMKTLNIPLVRVPLVLRALRSGVRLALPDLGIVPDFRLVVERLKERGFKLGIVTSNSTENVRSFLINNNMENCFDYLQAGAGIFAKAAAIKKAITRNGLKGEEVFFVGDEIRDIEAARKNGLAIIAVTWGLNSREGLAAAKPDSIVDKPEELLSLFSYSTSALPQYQ